MELPQDVLYEIAEYSTIEDFINLVTTRKLSINYLTLSKIYNLPHANTLGKLLFYSSIPMYKRLTYGNFEYIVKNIVTVYEAQCILETTKDSQIATYLSNRLGDGIYELSPHTLVNLTRFGLIGVEDLETYARCLYYQNDSNELMKINDAYNVLHYLPEDKQLEYLLSLREEEQKYVVNNVYIPENTLDAVAKVANLNPSLINNILSMPIIEKINKDVLIVSHHIYDKYILSRNYDRNVLIRSISATKFGGNKKYNVKIAATCLILVDDWNLASEILGKQVTSYNDIPFTTPYEHKEICSYAVKADNIKALEYFPIRSNLWPKSERMLLYLLARGAKDINLSKCTYDYKTVLDLYPSFVDTVLIDKVNNIAIVKELVPKVNIFDNAFLMVAAIEKGAIDSVKYLVSLGVNINTKKTVTVKGIPTLNYLLDIGVDVNILNSSRDEDEVTSELVRRGGRHSDYELWEWQDHFENN